MVTYLHSLRRIIPQTVLVVFLAGSVLFALGVPSSHAVQPANVSTKAVAAVNQVRAQMGLAPVQNDQRLAQACEKHAKWMSRNNMMLHGEQVGSPGYSLDGDLAGQASVLASMFEMRPQVSVSTIHWLVGAPLHMQQLLHPGLLRSGYAYDGYYACMVVVRPLKPFSFGAVTVTDPLLGRDTFYTYPIDGAQMVPVSESTATETPNPNEWVGLARTKVTGPYLYVYASGLEGQPVAPERGCAPTRVVSVSLKDTAGKSVKLRFIDDALAYQKTLGQEMHSGSCLQPHGQALLVPEKPLLNGMRYTAEVEMIGANAAEGSVPSSHSFSFTTALGKTPSVAKPVVRMRSSVVRRRGARVTWRYVINVSRAPKAKCSALVGGRPVPCRVRQGTILLAGSRVYSGAKLAVRVSVTSSSGAKTLSVSTRVLR